MANTSYYLYQKYEQRGNQDPIPVYPNIYSVDGDGSMPLVVKSNNDPNCGYIPPAEPIYRWTNMNISTDYICDDCVKFSANYSDETSYTIPCNSSTTLTYDETHPSGYTYSAMTDAYIGSCVTEIGSGSTWGVLGDTSGLTSVTISNGVKTIYSGAFNNCNGLTSIDIPDSVTTIGSFVFGNTRLNNVTIGSGITYIGEYAFITYSQSLDITIKATTPPTLANYAFFNAPINAIYVPAESVDAYKAASVWSDYAPIIEAIP